MSDRTQQSGSQQSALRRLERRVRLRARLNADLHRVRTSLPAIAQIVVGALASYAVAHYVVGHENPVLAVTVVVSSLGFARDARPRGILENAIGIFLGITLSESLLLLAGPGLWQIAVALAGSLLVARFLLPGNGFAVAAGVQSMFVMITPAPDGGVYTRSIDGLIAGACALLVTALIPRDPRAIARRDARRLFSAVDEALRSATEALTHADEGATTLGLERLRRTQSLIDDWATSLDSAIAIARISPFLRRHLASLRAERRALVGMDLAVRHLRVIVRRIAYLVRDGERREPLGGALAETADGIRLLGESLTDADAATAARDRLARTAATLDPATLLPGSAVAGSMLVLMMRPLLVDLQVAAGTSPAEANTALPTTAEH